MTDAKKPMAEANRISSMLNMVLGADRFPVKVDELALEYSRQCFADSPIDKVLGEDLDDLKSHLQDLYTDFNTQNLPGIKRVSELEVV